MYKPRNKNGYLRILSAMALVSVIIPGCNRGGQAPVRDPADEVRADKIDKAPEVDTSDGLNPEGEPNSQLVSLNAGFHPDPYKVEVKSGGAEDVGTHSLGQECKGFVSRNPDVRLDYSAGDYPLNFYTMSEGDTTIIVNMPDGTWVCSYDDDGHNPAVLINDPQSGRYAVWVGSHDGSAGDVTLNISEMPVRNEIPKTGDLERRPDVIFVPTPQVAVNEMLKMADIKKGDVLYDLGCGDGRIVITAAKKYGIRAYGFDIDPQRIKESKANVKKAGVGHLVTIQQADIFTLDLSKANIVTLYLLPRLNVKLMPQLRKMRPGSRIISFDFDMRGAKPKKVVERDFKDAGLRRIYKWVVPWKVEEEPDGYRGLVP